MKIGPQLSSFFPFFFHFFVLFFGKLHKGTPITPEGGWEHFEKTLGRDWRLRLTAGESVSFTLYETRGVHQFLMLTATFVYSAELLFSVADQNEHEARSAPLADD